MSEYTNPVVSRVMPVLPLRGITVFPNMLIHFDVGRDKSIRALEYAMKSDQLLFLVSQKDLRDDDPEEGGLYRVGSIARVRQILKMPGDNMRILVEGVSRARVISMMLNDAFIEADVEMPAEPRHRPSRNRTDALVRKIQELFEEYTDLMPKVVGDIMANVLATADPGYVSDLIAQNIQMQLADKQAILEEFNPVKRARKMIGILSREIEILKIENDLQLKVSYQMDKNQRDYFLREQIKVIQEELGDGEDMHAEADHYKEKILALRLCEESEQKLLKEADRLSRLQYTSPESGVIRTYLDTCLALLWNKKTKDKADLAMASKILDADHYGLEKVKERILEFLAVRSLAGSSGSQILCLVGPPGTGKTSVASSVARAMNRKFVRLSLGGVRDEADIRGHRKTYIGAMPGRVMTAISQAASKNCVLLLDEIDKMGHDFRGDPSAALLEVLDSAQNVAFRDHYIEIPFDLSDVFFITTANTYDTIPRPLLDRMEVIEISGYTDEEKLQIFKRHLFPKQLKKHGLRRSQLGIGDGAIRQVIETYTKESGVRSLERALAKICRKTAKKVIDGTGKKIIVSEHDLVDYLGTPKYKKDHSRRTDEVGLVHGLAWTRVGGELLEVEAGVVDGTGKLELTGNLGDVMKESTRAALTYIRSRARMLGIDTAFYKNKDMHVHFPEGATPKDGPSAGITAATALISALTGCPVRSDVAMTGEITLRGRVLPIGGLKEKTMAAYRAGMQTVILPEENLPDLDEIDPVVRAGLRFVPVAHMDAVLGEALAGKGSDRGAKEPKAQRKKEEKAVKIPSGKPVLPPNGIRQ